MNPPPKSSLTLKASQNPYAKLSLIDDDEEPWECQAKAYIRRLGNPYASLSIFPQDDEVFLPTGESESLEQPELGDLVPSPSINRPPVTAVSKKDFQTRCRSIFAQYSPSPTNRRIGLLPALQDFISKNSDRPSAERAKILVELEKYDFSAQGQLTPHFNRARPEDIMKKLAAITKSLEG